MNKSLKVIQPGEMIPGSTNRTDAWWKEPLMVVLVLGGFSIYATWAALQNKHYFVAPYISPFYSPCIADNCAEKMLPLVGKWWNLSPAFLILWVPGGFRATCYYYRRSYYRAFFGSPPGCAVKDRSKSYSGETAFPFVIQNIHRYFFWLSLVILGFLWLDAFHAFHFPQSGGAAKFGVGVGSLVLTANAVLLSLYSLSCHSCRHISGGGLNLFSKAPARFGLWKIVTRLNENHSRFAWVSLFGVALTDVYVRLLSMGFIKDIRII